MEHASPGYLPHSTRTAPEYVTNPTSVIARWLATFAVHRVACAEAPAWAPPADDESGERMFRTVTRFAFVPARVAGGWVWREWVEERQVWGGYDPVGWGTPWTTVERVVADA